MTGLRVTPEQLAQLGSLTARVSGDVRAQQQQLRSQLAPLCGSDWSGVAAAQFSSLYEEIDQHARGMCDALDGLGVLLARAGEAYADVERQIAASFR